MYNSNKIEDDLRENLRLYTAPPSDLGQDLFNAHRELSIIRYALSQQFKSYHLAVEILTNQLQSCEELVKTNPKALTDIMTCIYHIENKSQSLVKTAREVIELLGQVVNLDVDKAALRSMLINLPGLVEESILAVTQDASQASRISCNLSQRIDELMTTFKFEQNSLTHSNHSQPAGITLEQYQGFMDSVPTQP